MNEVRGFKVFNPDWTCRGKKYTCPGKFEEDVKIEICKYGMHFCRKAIDCFTYYSFSPDNKIAEVVAYGEIQEDGDKCCTNKLEIVREVSWHELLEIINTGHGCTGRGNSGNYNSGNFNSGSYNSGNFNSGHYNSGNFNSGDFNSGNYNSGHYNSGSYNSGSYNSGHFCSGSHCIGDFNIANYANGSFNTIEQKIHLFNKPSNLTYKDLMCSKARVIMLGMFETVVQRISSQEWWNNLTNEERNEVMSIPNFDKEIFKKVTGIDIDG